MSTVMLNELVEKIVVHESDRRRRADTKQKIEIYFNFIGEYIPLTMAEKEPTPEELEEMRKKEAKKDRLQREPTAICPHSQGRGQTADCQKDEAEGGRIVTVGTEISCKFYCK